MSEYRKLTQIYNSADLFKVIASLQLLAHNHGKNFRLKEIVRIAVANLNYCSDKVRIDVLEKALCNEFPYSEQEDHPVNLFTENVMFFNRNYIAFPGVTESGTYVLNSLFKAIYIADGDSKTLPKAFQSRIYDAMTLMLTMFHAAAIQGGLTYNYCKDGNSDTIEFPPEQNIDNLKLAVTFNEEWISTQFKEEKIDTSIINEFICDYKEPALHEEYCQHSPLDRRPLVKIDDEYIIVQPISCIECLIEFIWDEAKKHNCFDSLLKLQHEEQWHNMYPLFYKSQWAWTSAPLSPSSTVACKEAVFRFDINKVVYVCFLESGLTNTTPKDGFERYDTAPEHVLSYGEAISDRRNEVLDFLCQTESLDKQEIFTLYIVSEVGFPQQFAFPLSQKDQLCLWLRCSEFKHIVELEESDPLLLWKFAKCFTELTGRCEINYLGGTLDVFTYYRTHEYSLWPKNEEKPGAIAVMPGYSAMYSRASILKLDEHLAPFPHDGQLVYKFVYRHCDYAPFYMESGDTIPAPILLEDFIVPVWFINNQMDDQHEVLINGMLEMLAYRMYQLRPEIEKYLTFLDTAVPLTINVVLDKRFKREMRANEIPVVSLEEIAIPVIVGENDVEVTIPLELADWFAKPHNEGERHLMMHFLNSIIKDKSSIDRTAELKEIFDRILPKGPAKMFSMLGNANTLKMEKRFAPAYRPIQQADISFIRGNLISGYGINTTNEELSSTDGKNGVCMRIAETLYRAILKKLNNYNNDVLLPMLINYHEACVQQRELKALDLPQRIATISSFEKESENLKSAELIRAKTALSLRGLIEIISSNNIVSGTKEVGFDEIDELMALMDEMIGWATIADSIHLGVSNPPIAILPGERIEVNYEVHNKDLSRFFTKRNEISIDRISDNYTTLFDDTRNNEDERSQEVIEIDNAFKSEWGIEFTKLGEIVSSLAELIRSNNSSTACSDAPELYKRLNNTKNGWTNDQIAAALKVLSLKTGWAIGKPPEGYDKTDTYPWYYNRPLSFLYRPIATLVINNTIYYYWSYRHLFTAFDNLVILFFNGRLQVPTGGQIEKLQTKYRNKHGKKFRDEVSGWLTNNTTLNVIPYEVTIKPGGTLEATEDMGDIDVLAFDNDNKIIYSIECKDTVDSRSIHEMKTELDKYLGRNGNNGMTQKHVNRDQWLRKNHKDLRALINSTDTYEIKSVIITSEDIPLVYLKSEELPLPFIAFPRLEMEGIELLTDSQSTSTSYE